MSSDQSLVFRKALNPNTNVECFRWPFLSAAITKETKSVPSVLPFKRIFYASPKTLLSCLYFVLQQSKHFALKSTEKLLKTQLKMLSELKKKHWKFRIYYKMQVLVIYLNIASRYFEMEDLIQGLRSQVFECCMKQKTRE